MISLMLLLLRSYCTRVRNANESSENAKSLQKKKAQSDYNGWQFRIWGNSNHDYLALHKNVRNSCAKPEASVLSD